jgi:spermidine synthase
LIMVAVLLYLLAFIFVPAGQVLGRAFDGHPQVIRAYSVNIAGSLAGVWAVDGLSVASLSPPWWLAGGAVVVAVLVAVRGRREWLTMVLAGLAPLLAWLGGRSADQTVWSPYHKLTVSPMFTGDATNRVQSGSMINVNGTFFQVMRDRSESFLRVHPRSDSETALYYTPFWLKPSVKRVLVVGAGSGNNAAEALRHEVEQVDCVEIDPQIYALGRALHPERPYDSPRVRMIIQDARAFFKQATGPYDVIWFAWLDSHTLGSSYNNLRLDHYVYTRESFAEAKRLLAADGMIFVNFGAEQPWIADRLVVLLRETFGREPLAYAPGDATRVELVGSDRPLDLQPSQREFLERHRINAPQTTRPSTDDWPYLYMQRARIPKLHIVISLAILGTVALAGRRNFATRTVCDWHFFALGAAFLLLEVQTVSRATLLFGMTWIVNAIVITAVLVMILLANLVEHRWPRLPQWLIVAGLATSMTALAVVPLDSFNALAGATKPLVASAFLTAPVFFAGLLFIRSFAACVDKSRALGSNLIGALVGGLLESLSFVTGIRALVLLVGLFYVAALLTRPQDLHAADQCPQPTNEE